MLVRTIDQDIDAKFVDSIYYRLDIKLRLHKGDSLYHQNGLTTVTRYTPNPNSYNRHNASSDSYFHIEQILVFIQGCWWQRARTELARYFVQNGSKNMTVLNDVYFKKVLISPQGSDRIAF